MNHILKLYTCLIIAGSFLLSCSSPSTETPSEEHAPHEESIIEFTKAQYDIAGIEVGKVEQRQISGTIKVNGELDVPPQQMINISVPLGGFLKHTDLLQGSYVKKGQRIATIENIEFVQLQQDYLEALNQLEFANADFGRQQELAKENVNAQKTLQAAKAQFTDWQIKSSGIREKLKMLNINFSSLEAGNISSTIQLYAPINGYVTEVNVNIGKYVNPNDVLFEIVDTNHLHAELIVFEKDVPKLKLGQKVRFTLANESTDRMATIYLIGRKISKDRTIRIHCHIDKEDTELLPGMYLKANVETGGALVPTLPNEAVIDFQGKKYIFVPVAIKKQGDGNKNKEVPAEEQQFEMVEIQIGNSELGFTEIGIPEGYQNDMEVVMKGAYFILSKLKNSEEEGGNAH